MENKEKTGFAKTFSIWFGLGALMFGTFCGANMASGVYAAGYIVTLGGGWALVWLAMFCFAMSFFCAVGLNFVRAFKVSNYNAYYLALYNVHKPDANPMLRGVVTVFFDLYTMAMGVVTVAATISLFAELMNTLLGIPSVVASIAGVLLFTVLTIYGAAFLRKFNTVMTVSSWGSTLSNYSDQIQTKKDAIGTGVTIGVLVTLLFIMTGLIVLPFMPEVMAGTPILMICQQYLSPVLTIIYWIVVIFSVVSTAPSFTYNFSNRWVTLWKGEQVSRKVKFFILSLAYLVVCWIISGVGLMAIVQKGYIMLGKIALFAIVIPLFISIPRVWKKDKEDAAA